MVPQSGCLPRAASTTQLWPERCLAPTGPAVGFWRIPPPSLQGPYRLVGLATDRTDGDIGLAEIGRDTGGAEPGGDGAAAVGEEDASKQLRQANGRTFVEPEGQASKDTGQKDGQVQEYHGRLLDTGPCR